MFFFPMFGFRPVFRSIPGGLTRKNVLQMAQEPNQNWKPGLLEPMGVNGQEGKNVHQGKSGETAFKVA